ncbi:MAG: cell division protein FtsA [Bacteroides sp.]|nr:cell division protein FtsA [Bacteroides sp.]MDE6235234.1 cell division protein FtsA [Muribaculaceae bacterium]
MERYVAAIEISSSKIIGVIGRVQSEGRVDIVAVEQEKCVESVRYGVIQNLEETSMRLARILEKLERKPAIHPKKIQSVFIGLNARSLHSIPTTVRLQLPDDTEITDDILQRLRHDALNVAIDSSLEIVDVVPRKYKIGTRETPSPKGSIGNSIQADYDIIVCRPEVKRNILRVVQNKLGIDIDGFVVTPLSTGLLILSPEEKRLGCMLVDIGAETTAVTIYRDGALNYFATLPLGGRNITRDITYLSMLEERAEEIKITLGNAIQPESPSTLNLNGIKFAEVSNYVVARSEEIVANIIEQIAYAGLKEKDLPGGIICIGGGSKLNGMTELISRQLGGIPVKMGRLPSYVHMEDVKGPSSEIVEVASVLYAGATLTNAQCLEEPKQDELPVIGTSGDDEREDEYINEPARPRPGNTLKFVNKIKNGFSRLFAGPEDEDETDSLD